ncbi:MAG TPA: TolC family protein [Burkholderiales bacterium]|nr:TolC family protein [Burkholderiales bacterium]
MVASSASRGVAVALAAVALAGCATFSTDGGFGAVEETAQQRTGAQPRWQRTDADRDEVARLVSERLAAPLAAEDAVRIALVNNPGLQAIYAELGIAEADVVAAGRLPSIHIASLKTTYGGETVKIEQAIGIEVIALLTVPLRHRYEAKRFERVQAEVAREAVAVAYETRRAWVEAVAAEETARYLAEVRAAAEASAELARRMARAGNYSRLQQMRDQVFYADAVAQLARARQAAVAARERLTRLMGLSGRDVAYRLPERLPDLPASPAQPAEVEATALQGRLDILAAQRDVASLADSLGLVKTTRFINVLEVGRARTKEGTDPFAYGWEFRIEIPLFDFGTARVARAEALYLQAVSRVAQAAVDAESELREAYSAYRTAYDTARHYRDEIVPLRRRIAEETLLRYNGMLISVFELLADARAQVIAVNAALDATRDYWLAETDLQSALAGAGTGLRAARWISPMPVAQTGGGH